MNKKNIALNLFSVLTLSTVSISSFAFEVPARREFPVNTAINPCDNFYEYACSKVNASFTLPDDRSKHTFSFSDPAERILEFKKKYFDQLAIVPAKGAREQQLKNYYLACMDEPSRAKEEVEFVKTMKEKLDKIKTREELASFFSAQIMEPESGALVFETMNNQDRPTWNDIAFDTNFLTLPEKSYYEKPEVTDGLFKIQTSFFKAVGFPDPEKTGKIANAFEKELAKTYPTRNDFRNLYTQRTDVTKEELIQKYPYLKLKAFLANIPEKTHIRQFIPATMQFLNDQIEKAPIEDLKAVYLFRTTAGFMDDAYPEFYKEFFQFRNKHLGGPVARPARKERCTKLVMNNFPKEIDSILWPRFFPNFPKQKIVSIAEKIRGSILSMLKANTWLSPDAKKEAIKKIKTARLQLVAPKNDEEWDFNPAEKYSPKTPIQNSRILDQALKKKDLAELSHEISKNRWSMGPMTINAYYNSSYNKFVLPVGILQYPFFDPKLPEEINLAAIGTVIGHELGHSIDDKGSKFNSDGMLKTWMTDADLAEFKHRGAIIIDQFKAIGHNGELTLGENIGDLVGLAASYRAAYELNSKNKNPASKKDFFLQFARVWCEVERPSYTELRLKTDPHSLGFARTNEQVKQNPAFEEAYGCKATDKMVLPNEKRAKIWW